MTRRGQILLFVPALALLLVVAFLLALPSLVSSGRHRAVIEALASSITGRQVNVAGRLSLAILPTPQLIAERITITGTDGEVVTAKSLILDIDVAALLRGRLSARSLLLQSPDIRLPWPLRPATPATPWLTALHAQISDGRLGIGTLHFDHIAADLFTGPAGAFSLSGTATFGTWPLEISLGLGTADAAGHAPLSLDLKADDASKLSAHLSGTLNGGDSLAGTLQAAGIVPGTSLFTSGQAQIRADRDSIIADAAALRQGAETLSGTAAFNATDRSVTATLTGQNLDLTQFQPLLAAAGGLAGRLTIAASNTSIAGATLPSLTAAADFDGSQMTLHRLDATLPGNSELTASGAIGPDRDFTGTASLATLDLPTLAAAYGGPANLPSNWRQARITAGLHGNLKNLSLAGLHGSLGHGQFSGSLVLARGGGGGGGVLAASGQLHFGQLDLTPLAGLLHNLPPLAKTITLNGEITADAASLYGLQLNRLLVDADFSDQLVVRRLSASLGGGLAASSFTLAPGRVTIARLLLSLPTAAPLLALLPPAWQPPLKLAAAPLSLALLAAGPTNALAANAVADLGDAHVTAAPILDLAHLTATGALTLRYPSAIAALAAFGIKSGLSWPGAGSLALRADASYTPAAIGLPDFVLSLGDVAANGKITLTNGHTLAGQIDADTLALPALPPGLALPWPRLARFDATLKLRANRILLGGASVLGPTQANLAMTADTTTLSLASAAIAGGNLTGSATLQSHLTPPSLVATLNLTGADAAALPSSLPFTLASGRLAGEAALTASGYTPTAWLATLAGTAALTATNGTLNGFNLSALVNALHGASRATSLRTAATTGSSAFTSLTLAGKFDQGSYNITTAAMQGPDGAATAAGSIDVPDGALTLRLSLLPHVTPPLTIGVTTIGSWTAARQVADTDAGLNWQATP